MAHDEPPILIRAAVSEERKPSNRDGSWPVFLKRRVKDADRRRISVGAPAAEDIHRAIRVGNLRISESLVRGIQNGSIPASADYRHLIVESFRSAEISLREIRQQI